MKYLDPDATKTWTESGAFVDNIYPNKAEQFIRESDLLREIEQADYRWDKECLEALRIKYFSKSSETPESQELAALMQRLPPGTVIGSWSNQGYKTPDKPIEPLSMKLEDNYTMFSNHGAKINELIQRFNEHLNKREGSHD